MSKDFASKADIYLPLYIGDYMADTMHLSAEQHGIYMLLIMHYWRNGGAIKKDQNFLKNVCRSSWKKCEQILTEFFTLADNYYHHKRIDKEIKKSLENKESRQEKAKKGAAARWQKNDAPSNAPSMPQALPEGMLKQCPLPLPINNNNSACAPKIFDFEELSENERKVAEAIGIERLGCDLGRVQEWVTAGYDIDQDVVPAIKATLKKYPKQAINSLSYFDDPIKRRRDKGELPPKAANNPPADKPKQTIDPDGIMPKVLRDVAKSNADLGVGADVMRRSIIGLGFGGKRDGTVYLHQPQGNQALCQSLNDDYGHKFLESWRSHDATVTAVRVVVAS